MCIDIHCQDFRWKNWPSMTYPIVFSQVIKEYLASTDFVLDSPNRPIFAEDIHSFITQHFVSSSCKHQQVIRLTSTVIQLRPQESTQVAVHLPAGGWSAGPVRLGAAGAVWIQGIRWPFILKHLFQYPPAVPWGHPESHPLLPLSILRCQQSLPHFVGLHGPQRKGDFNPSVSLVDGNNYPLFCSMIPLEPRHNEQTRKEVDLWVTISHTTSVPVHVNNACGLAMVTEKTDHEETDSLFNNSSCHRFFFFFCE